MVRWTDGMEWTVEEVTNVKFRAWQKGRGGKKDEPLWKGTHSQSKNELEIVQKPDRGVILALNEQGKQVCAVRICLFGHVADTEPMVLPLCHEALVKALTFMKKLAEDYASGSVETGKLKKEKEDRMKTMGLKTRVGAAAPAGEGSASATATGTVKASSPASGASAPPAPTAAPAPGTSRAPAPKAGSAPRTSGSSPSSASATATSARSAPRATFVPALHLMPYGFDDEIADRADVFEDRAPPPPRAFLEPNCGRCYGMYIHMYAYVYAYIHIHMCTHIYIYSYMHIHTDVYIYAHIRNTHKIKCTTKSMNWLFSAPPNNPTNQQH